MTTRSHRAYAATQRETSVSSAKPVELVAMVYQRLLDHLHTGKIQMAEGADSSESLTKAIDLITTGLESCLDKEKGGEIIAAFQEIRGPAGPAPDLPAVP